MTETTDRTTTTPGWDDAPLPKRNGHKGMLPSTWLGRELRVEYEGSEGRASVASGVLLDWFPAGPERLRRQDALELGADLLDRARGGG